jgi:transposase
LLPDRKSSTLEAWLNTHPSARIVTRDRSKEFAQGITQGAPRAQQVVDRWHLLKNLREVLQRVVDGYQKVVTSILQGVRSVLKLPRFGKENDLRDAARERQRARHERVRTAFAEIGTISGTAKKLGVSRWLVRESQKPGDPVKREANKRIPSQLDAFESHLFKRWTQGCQTTTELWLELQGLGVQGSRRMVRRWMLRQRLAALKEFAVGLEREISAIKAAFSLEWSNRPVEGVVNKIKLVKRQMFGRASFEVLRRRMLRAA